jgi:hypothetical protein
VAIQKGRFSAAGEGQTQAQVRAQYGDSKQVKQNSEAGKKWVCVLREPKLRNPNYSMFAKATILTIHFDQTLGA